MIRIALDAMGGDNAPGEIVRGGVEAAVGLEAMVNEADEDAALLRYLASNEAKLEKLLECPWLLRSPVVRNGRQATVGYCPEVWKGWE